MLFAMFQLMFAAITPALITGAFAERKRFGSFVLFTILWSILIYSPIAHWVWSTDGWLFKLGALDFAGGTVVHISSGVSALVVALMIGKRHMNGESTEPHDVPMVVLGAGLLWFGWFGFNAGSALTAGGLAASAFTVTNIAAAAATITWVLAELRAHAQGQRRRCRLRRGRRAGRDHPGVRATSRRVARSSSAWSPAACATAPRSCEPAPASTTRSTSSPSTASAACSGRSRPASSPRAPSRPPTPACSTATRSSSSPRPSPSARPILYAAVGTVVIVKVVDVLLGIRVKPEVEEMGLDLSVHGEAAYQV